MSLLAYIPAEFGTVATVEVCGIRVTIRRPAIGLCRAGGVFATVLTLFCGAALWIMSSLDPSTPVPAIGIAAIALLCIAISGYAWMKAIDEASRRYVLFLSEDALQIHSEGWLGERNDLWQREEFVAIWFVRTPARAHPNRTQLNIKLTSGEILTILSELDLNVAPARLALQQALGGQDSLCV